MIHATLADGQTLLFDPDETVITAEWISDDWEYFSQVAEGPASDLVLPGDYVVWRDAPRATAAYAEGSRDMRPPSKVKTVRVV